MHVDHIHQIQRMLAVGYENVRSGSITSVDIPALACAGDHRVGVGTLHSFRAEPHHLIVLSIGAANRPRSPWGWGSDWARSTVRST